MCPAVTGCEEIEASLVVGMEETGVGSQEGVRGFQNKGGGGERKEGERDGVLAGGCVGLELMMYCASFSPTACFPARFMWRPLPGEVFY